MRFLHTADWQLGMTRHFLPADAQARYTAARLDAVRELGRIAVNAQCAFIIVCGDVFESNLLRPQVVGRALEALRSIPLPVYLLPGNHDPVDAASIYGSAEFTRHRPDNVHVLSTMRDKARLDDLLEGFTPLFAAVQAWERRTDLAVRPDEDDFGDLGLSGFAATALAELKETAVRGGDAASVAQDALGLLYRRAGVTT